jgi:hypothetical protein
VRSFSAVFADNDTVSDLVSSTRCRIAKALNDALEFIIQGLVLFVVKECFGGMDQHLLPSAESSRRTVDPERPNRDRASKQGAKQVAQMMFDILPLMDCASYG